MPGASGGRLCSISRATLPPDAWLELGAALTTPSAAGAAHRSSR